MVMKIMPMEPIMDHQIRRKQSPRRLHHLQVPEVLAAIAGLLVVLFGFLNA